MSMYFKKKNQINQSVTSAGLKNDVHCFWPANNCCTQSGGTVLWNIGHKLQQCDFALRNIVTSTENYLESKNKLLTARNLIPRIEG